MSMGTPGWNPGADAMRVQQENDRLNRESVRRMQEGVRLNQENMRNAQFSAVPRGTSSGRVGGFFRLLVALAVLAAVIVFALYEVGQHRNVSAPPDDGPCVTIPDCVP